MSNRIIIKSFSKMAAKLAVTLRQKDYYIIIIEENKNLIEEATALGYEVKNISLMKDENIIEVGLTQKDLKAFFCMGNDKSRNLFITLSVRNLNKDIKIIALSSSKEDNKTLLLAGANKTINPYEIGALRIFRSLHKPLVLEVLDNILFSKSDIQISEITIKKGSVFDGVSLIDLKRIGDNNDIIILGITDKEISDSFIFLSLGINHIIDNGDIIVILGRSHHLKKFKSELNHII